MPRGEPIFSREKDRACYLHQLVEVDLTVVTARVSGGEFQSSGSALRRTGRHYPPLGIRTLPTRRDALLPSPFMSIPKARFCH
jgi:hypothetical protein